MDVVAALRCWPIDVTVGEWRYQVPALPAADWVQALVSYDLTDVIPGLLPVDDEAEILDLLGGGEINPADVQDAARDAVEAAAGRTWWEAYRLVGLLAEPTIAARVIMDGFDFERRSIAALCWTIFGIVVSGMDEKERRRFVAELELTPVTVARDDEVGQSDAFMAALLEKQRMSGAVTQTGS